MLSQRVKSSIIVELEPEQFARLQSLADSLGISIEGLARSTIEDLLAGTDAQIEQVAENVLRKNKELYRRLA